MKVKANITKIFNDPNSNIKALASVNLDEHFIVNGIKICENESGLFVTMPALPFVSNGKTRYREMFRPITKGASIAIKTAVMNKYTLELSHDQQTNIEIQDITDDEEETDMIDEPESEMSM